LLELCDVLVDSPFILAERDLSLPFRGSRNQRVIDVQPSLEKKEIILKDVMFNF
jgi:anaerobic ribonucleoside-triphosphate reductase activating protein